MKLAIMQPYLFPYIGYWQLINAVDQFVIFDDVTFIKKGFINRNNILVQGEARRFSLQLLKASQNKLINEIEIGDNAEEILNMIFLAYKLAPYFNDVFPTLEVILRRDEKNLAKFIGHSLLVLSEYLEINTHFIYSSEINKDNTLKGQDKIINICKKFQTDVYVNASGGRLLYDADTFKINNIDLWFIESSQISYQQFKNDFVPNLSIIDLIMFNDKTTIQSALDGYALKR